MTKEAIVMTTIVVTIALIVIASWRGPSARFDITSESQSVCVWAYKGDKATVRCVSGSELLALLQEKGR
jgi:hypothetical protein